MELELYDCTLREGEQAAGAHFSLEARVNLFKELEDFGFNYVELGWPLSSEDIGKSFELCREVRKKSKIVAFGSTSRSDNVEDDINLKSLLDSKADYSCIFGKTIKEHIEMQLKISPEDNLKRIEKSVEFLLDNSMPVFYDAEHFFDGFKDDESYALSTLLAAHRGGAEKIILCDTKGGVIPVEVQRAVKKVRDFFGEKNIEIDLGVHFHNDSGLALANTLVSLDCVKQIQGTINGTGERVGNLNFSEFIPVCVRKLGQKLDFDISKLKQLHDNSFRYVGLEVPKNVPFVGENAFTHKGGTHIDAINKNASYEHESPEEFGNKRVVLLNTLGGRGVVVAVAKEHGYDLDKNNSDIKSKIKNLFEELRDIERRGYNLGNVSAEQFLLVEKYFGNLKRFFELQDSYFETRIKEDTEESRFTTMFGFVGEEKENLRMHVEGGPIDAAYKALQKAIGEKHKEVYGLRLVDFHVGIARYHGEESSVRTSISFSNGESFETIGVDKNIMQSSLEALEKGFRYYLNKLYKEKKD